MVRRAVDELDPAGGSLLLSRTWGTWFALRFSISANDLLPYLDFDVTACLAYARRVNPALRVFQISAKTGEGVPALCEWLAAETEGAWA